MKKLFYTEREVELIKRELEMVRREVLSASENDKRRYVIEEQCNTDKRLAEKNAEITALTESNKHAVKAAEQVIREKFEKAILELTERVSIAEAKNSEMEIQRNTVVIKLEKEIERISSENVKLTNTLTTIATEKAHVVTPNASPAHMVVVQDGKQIEIVK